jgi:hypothetical protein
MKTMREFLQGAGAGEVPVSLIAVRSGQLDLAPAKDLEELAARLRDLEGVREEFYAQQMLAALKAQQGGK